LSVHLHVPHQPVFVRVADEDGLRRDQADALGRDPVLAAPVGKEDGESAEPVGDRRANDLRFERNGFDPDLDQRETVAVDDHARENVGSLSDPVDRGEQAQSQYEAGQKAAARGDL
jgi:hypothetical protein